MLRGFIEIAKESVLQESVKKAIGYDKLSAVTSQVDTLSEEERRLKSEIKTFETRIPKFGIEEPLEIENREKRLQEIYEQQDRLLKEQRELSETIKVRTAIYETLRSRQPFTRRSWLIETYITKETTEREIRETLGDIRSQERILENAIKKAEIDKKRAFLPEDQQAIQKQLDDLIKQKDFLDKNKSEAEKGIEELKALPARRAMEMLSQIRELEESISSPLKTLRNELKSSIKDALKDPSEYERRIKAKREKAESITKYFEQLGTTVDSLQEKAKREVSSIKEEYRTIITDPDLEKARDPPYIDDAKVKQALSDFDKTNENLLKQLATMEKKIRVLGTKDCKTLETRIKDLEDIINFIRSEGANFSEQWKKQSKKKQDMRSHLIEETVRVDKKIDDLEHLRDTAPTSEIKRKAEIAIKSSLNDRDLAIRNWDSYFGEGRYFTQAEKKIEGQIADDQKHISEWANSLRNVREEFSEGGCRGDAPSVEYLRKLKDKLEKILQRIKNLLSKFIQKIRINFEKYRFFVTGYWSRNTPNTGCPVVEATINVAVPKEEDYSKITSEDLEKVVYDRAWDWAEKNGWKIWEETGHPNIDHIGVSKTHSDAKSKCLGETRLYEKFSGVDFDEEINVDDKLVDLGFMREEDEYVRK